MIDTLNYVVIVALMLIIMLGSIRAIKGPTITDRLLATQLFSTVVTAIMVMISLGEGRAHILNIALVYSLLTGVLGIVYTGYWRWTGATASEAKQESEHELE
jgi:multicomponent Na+:H+ antiporter subunit F